MTIERLTDGSVPLELLAHATLWPLLGLLAARRFAHRPARAQLVLLAASGAAVLGVGLAAWSHALGWGLLPARVMSATGSTAVADVPIGATPSVSAAWWPLAALLGWSVLSSLLLTRLAVAFVRGRALVRRSTPCDDPALNRAAHDAARLLGLRATPRLLTNERLRTPAVWCWAARPVVLLPSRPAPIDDGAWRAVFLHELGHCLRRDHLAQLAVDLVACLLPWQPLVWIARRRHAALCEAACDAWALRDGGSPIVLADLLVRLADRCQRRPRLATPVMTLSMASSGRELRRRVHQLLDAPVEDPRLGTRWATALALATVLVASTAALAHRRDAVAPQPAVHASLEFGLPPRLALSIQSLTPPERAAQPLRAAPGELDLGVVPPGGEGLGTLTLVNVSADPIELVGISASCGCTTVGGFETGGLDPGAVTTLEIRMTAPKDPGAAKTKHVTITVDRGPPLRVPVSLRTGAAG